VNAQILTTSALADVVDDTPDFIRTTLSEMTDVEEVAINLIEWNVLRLTANRPIATIRITARRDSNHPRRGCLKLRLEFSDATVWNVGIRYGRPLILREFPRRSTFDMEAFDADPLNPESCGLVLVERRECLAAFALIVKGVRERNPAVHVEWPSR
jgi:hypothetical protein